MWLSATLWACSAGACTNACGCLRRSGACRIGACANICGCLRNSGVCGTGAGADACGCRRRGRARAVNHIKKGAHHTWSQNRAVRKLPTCKNLRLHDAVTRTHKFGLARARMRVRRLP
eukprot:3079162-Pleurochrysis_carterae.AAC.1